MVTKIAELIILFYLEKDNKIHPVARTKIPAINSFLELLLKTPIVPKINKIIPNII